MTKRNEEQKDNSEEVYDRLMSIEMDLRSSETEYEML